MLLNDQLDSVFIFLNEIKFQHKKQNYLYFAREIIKKSPDYFIAVFVNGRYACGT